LHGTYALNPKVLGGKSFIEDLFNKFIFAKVLKKCDAIVGGTTEIIEYASKYSSSSSKFRLIPNGVLTNNYLSNLIKKADFREKFYLDKHKLVVLYVGRFDESKGALEFARAAKMLLNAMPNVFQVLMVGEGHLETEIRKITQGLDGMQIKEWQPATTIHEFYIASDFYVLSSKFEGLPLSIIEAMNANLHIVYSDVGGVNDILKGYKKKSILKNSTPEEIFEVLSEKSNDKSLTDIHQPSMVYAQSYDWANIAAEMELLYKELIFFR
jgi:glycosyltransferase involved in cell wall biosynthesis